MALFLSEFLYRAIREEAENRPLFAYLQHSIIWLDECGDGFANFHLVFLMRLSRFLGLYPNLEDYHTGDYFDLLNACFTSIRPQLHSSYINPEEAARLRQLMRMNYETMHLFGMSRAERTRCLLDKVAQHALGDQKVRDHALPHGPDRHNIARCPSNHLTRFFSNCPYFICIFIIRNYGRLL